MSLEVSALSSMSAGSKVTFSHTSLTLFTTSRARRFSILQSSSKCTLTVVTASAVEAAASEPRSIMSQLFTLAVVRIVSIMPSVDEPGAGRNLTRKPSLIIVLAVSPLFSMSSGMYSSSAQLSDILLMTRRARRFSILQSSSKKTFTVVSPEPDTGAAA